MQRILLAFALSCAMTPTALAQMPNKDAISPATIAYVKALVDMAEVINIMVPSGDSSADFVMMMTPHHQAAVEMAEAYLKYGKDPTLTRMAKNIIATQKGNSKNWPTGTRSTRCERFNPSEACVSRRIGCISEFPRCALGPAPAASCYGNALMECASRPAVSALDLPCPDLRASRRTVERLQRHRDGFLNESRAAHAAQPSRLAVATVSPHSNDRFTGYEVQAAAESPS